MDDESSISRSEKIHALSKVSRYRPTKTVGLIGLSLLAAVLEGVGLGFLIPIIEQARSAGQPPTDAGGVLGTFAHVYDFLDIPFTLEYTILGVASVMTVRYTSSFLVAWLRATLWTDFTRHLQKQLFDNMLDARIEYFDSHSSDEILNATVTQATYAGRSIRDIVLVVQSALLAAVYVSVALYLAPGLTVGTAVVLASAFVLLRNVLESGYDVGDRVAEANERVQGAVQAGTQGIRDVRLFGMSDELYADFHEAVDQYADSTIRLHRNEAAITNLYLFTVSVTVFGLIYFAVTISTLSLSGLGVFLFAMFRLGPELSKLSNNIYQAEGNLPHLIRTQENISELESSSEPNPASQSLPAVVGEVTFDDVEFAYESGETVIDGLSFSVKRGEFVAFVGSSGVGKSTIVSLLTRMYVPDSGRILADDRPVEQVDIDEWRSRLGVVRQKPHVFNNTLRYNVTVGNRDVSEEEFERAVEVAQVTEFIDELPDGYDTTLGDDGIRLSGGQRQRIAIARALLKDSDVIILDEATSDLDTTLEKKVHDGIEEIERNYAIIVIAHRLSTVTNADRIYAMEKGAITECGSHEQLLALDGKYASLYTVQTEL